MGLFGGGNKTTVTENKTDVYSSDNRVAASDSGIALASGASLDQSIDFHDESDRSQTYNIQSLDKDVALAAIAGGASLGNSAVSLFNSSLSAMAAADRERNQMASQAIDTVAEASTENLTQALDAVSSGNGRALDSVDQTNALAFDALDSSNSRAFDLALAVAQRGQDESAAARAGAESTIKEVLGFKEAGDTKVAQDLIKWGALAVAAIAALFLFFGGRKSN